MKQTRKIVSIDEAKCNGCGLCVPSCAEGAIEIVNGKARLASDVYCDGLGACLGKCPQDAITVEEREADAFDEKATERHLAAKKSAPSRQAQDAEAAAKPAATPSRQAQGAEAAHGHSGCPGSRMVALRAAAPAAAGASAGGEVPSQLSTWPVKMILAPVTAPWYQGATLLIAADCSAFAHGDFHRRFLSGKPLLTFCPKFGEIEGQKEKLAEILRENDVRAVEVLYMQVPCCSGLAWLAQSAVEDSLKSIPLTLTKLSLRGEVLEEQTLGAGAPR